MLFKPTAQNPQGAQSAKPAAPGHDKAAPAKALIAAPTPPVVAPRPVATPADTTDGGKRLIVGEGIQMKGEITACDRLVVEGQVEVTLKATRMLEIKLNTAYSRLRLARAAFELAVKAQVVR